MRSLRFRIPALFLGGIVLSAVVAAVLALGLFQDYARQDTLTDLRRQASGLATLYALQAERSVEQRRRPLRIAASLLERATDTRLYYAGLQIFPGQISGLRTLDLDVLDAAKLRRGEVQTFEFVPPGLERTYLAVAHPLELGGEPFGALVVAKPGAELRERWLGLARRLGLAFLAGILVAAALALYLSRRLTSPVLALSRAADRVAEGRYDVALPPARRGDEIGHLTDRFREMTQRLAQAEQVERHFLMTVSHELRTPLTAIRGHVEALREGLAGDAESRSASLEVIRSETERLERLVGDLIDLARLDTRRFALVEEEVDMHRLLEHAHQSFTEEARAREVRFERRFEPGAILHTDGDRVLQIVSNLLRNAFAWTPSGGQVTLELGRLDGTVTIAVTDTGPGIPSREHERVFRPFWSGDGSGGLGLGLAIARELAHALGGELRLESEVGQGSRFELTLPSR